MVIMNNDERIDKRKLFILKVKNGISTNLLYEGKKLWISEKRLLCVYKGAQV